MKTFLKTLICISPFLLASDCGDDWYQGGKLNFMIVNSDYENIVGTGGEPYHPDTIQVFNNRMQPQLLHKRFSEAKDGGWRFILNYLGDKAPVEINFNEFDRTFYLYMNHNDLDTIRVIGDAMEVYINGEKLGGVPPNIEINQYTTYYYVKQ